MTTAVLSINQEQFQEARKQGIGSSEIGTLLGVNDYMTPYQLWLVKTGREKGFEGNKYTIAGHRLEGAVAEYFEDETGNVVIKESAPDITYYHPMHHFALATPDREYILNDLSRGILECKTTQKSIDPEFPPETWFCQLQWQLGILNAQDGAAYEEGSTAWLFRGLDFHCVHFEYDAAFFQYLLDKAGRFWEKHVLQDTPPPAKTGEDIQRAFPKHFSGKVVKATEELRNDYQRLIEVRAQKKVLELEEEQIKERMKLIMRDAEAISYYEETLVTWRASKPSRKFQKNAFETDHPELYQAYVEEVPGSRRFLVK